MKQITKAELLKLIDRESPLILDIGAYNGKDSYEFAELGCTVHSFEPLSYNRAIMKQHDNVFVHPYALGAKQRMAEFRYSAGHTQSGSLMEPKNHLTIWPDIEFESTEIVQVRTLDSWFAMFGRDIDLIWADVNGSECDLIRGGMETLKNTRFLFIETSNRELFVGQQDSETLISLLPGWDVLGLYNYMGNFGNLLLKNGGVTN